jgi:hypothetical protein
VQKKITPWRLGIQEQEPELQLAPQQRAARLGKAHGALVVVASLIDKPTNLGGQRSVRIRDPPNSNIFCEIYYSEPT